MPDVDLCLADGPEGVAARHKVTLKRWMMVVIFADAAKTSGTVVRDSLPLFLPTSAFKSTASFLTAFARDYLAQAGDMEVTVNAMGGSVAVVQTPVDEMEVKVDAASWDVETGLPDGLVLARLVEVLGELPAGSLYSRMMLPAISRLQKLHNTDVVLAEVKSRWSINVLSSEESGPGDRFGGRISSRSLVDGLVEPTLSLLWELVVNAVLPTLVSVDESEDEIKHVGAGLGDVDELPSMFFDAPLLDALFK